MSERTFKNVKPENDGINFVRAKKLKDEGFTGTVLEGTFVGSSPNPLDERKEDYKFELENGDITVINGAGNLGYSMKFVDLGQFVQVNYLGMQEIQKGAQKGRMSHNFEVLRED